MVCIAVSIVSQKICKYVDMWNYKKFKHGYFLMCWSLSLQVDFFFFVLLRQSTPFIQDAEVGEYFSLLVFRAYIRISAFKLQMYVWVNILCDHVMLFHLNYMEDYLMYPFFKWVFVTLWLKAISLDTFALLSVQCSLWVAM